MPKRHARAMGQAPTIHKLPEDQEWFVLLRHHLRDARPHWQAHPHHSVRRAQSLPPPPNPATPSARIVGGGATLQKGARVPAAASRAEDLTGLPSIVSVAGCARGTQKPPLPYRLLHRAYVHSNSTAGAAMLTRIPPLMSSSAQRRTLSGSGLRVITFNIAKSYFDLDTLLEDFKDDFNVLFIQEPPWQTIRHATSTLDAEGAPVVGAPRHPQWNCMVRQPEPGSRPRVMTYVSKRLDQLRPAYRRDLIDDRDVMVISPL